MDADHKGQKCISATKHEQPIVMIQNKLQGHQPYKYIRTDSDIASNIEDPFHDPRSVMFNVLMLAFNNSSKEAEYSPCTSLVPGIASVLLCLRAPQQRLFGNARSTLAWHLRDLDSPCADADAGHADAGQLERVQWDRCVCREVVIERWQQRLLQGKPIQQAHANVPWYRQGERGEVRGRPL